MKSGGDRSVLLTPADVIGDAGGGRLATPTPIATPTPTQFARSQQASLTRPARWFDLALVVLLAPFVLVVAGAIAIAIYLDSPGRVIFRSRRVGRDGVPFEMFKFRKMRSQATDYPLTLKDDVRFTPIGRFLAKTRLDELPQVVNVLRGEMCLVGPRPELECFVDEFAEEYETILRVCPGITGAAQLRFLDEKSMLHHDDPASAYCDHVLPEKVKIDVRYARTRTFSGDLAILARTLALPLSLALAWGRARRRHVWSWLPASLLAAALVLAFALSSSNIG